MQILSPWIHVFFFFSSCASDQSGLLLVSQFPFTGTVDLGLQD